MDNLGKLKHADSAAPQKGPAPVPGRLPRVLFIEDNLGLSSGMRVLLERLGYEVVLAHDGQEGLAEAHRLPPDVVICDLGLPEMSGYQVARRLREAPDTRDVSLIAVSGHSHNPCADLAREAGFDCFLAKPVCIEDLRVALEPPEGQPRGRERSEACLSGFFSH